MRVCQHALNTFYPSFSPPPLLSWRPPSFLFLSHLYADDALVDEVHAVTLVACPHHVLSTGHTHNLQSIHHLLQA